MFSPDPRGRLRYVSLLFCVLLLGTADLDLIPAYGQNSSGDPSPLLKEGAAAYYQNNYTTAVDLLTKFIHQPIGRDLYAAYMHRGAAYGYLGNFEKGSRDFESALSIDSRDPILFYMRAVTLYMRQQKWDKAIDDLTHAFTLNPTLPARINFYLTRSSCYAQIKKDHAALGDLHEALKLGPENAAVYRELGNFYMTRDLPKAIENFQRARDLNPGDLYNFAVLGNAYRMKGEWARALAEYNKALQISPRNAEMMNAVSYVYRSRAYLYVETKQWQSAHDDLQKAAEFYLGDIQAQKELGDLYAVLGNGSKREGAYGRAIEDYSEAIRLNPRNPAAHAGRGFAKILKGAKQDALPDLQNACRLGHSNACLVLENLK